MKLKQEFQGLIQRSQELDSLYERFGCNSRLELTPRIEVLANDVLCMPLSEYLLLAQHAEQQGEIYTLQILEAMVISHVDQGKVNLDEYPLTPQVEANFRPEVPEISPELDAYILSIPQLDNCRKLAKDFPWFKEAMQAANNPSYDVSNFFHDDSARSGNDLLPLSYFVEDIE